MTTQDRKDCLSVLFQQLALAQQEKRNAEAALKFAQAWQRKYYARLVKRYGQAVSNLYAQALTLWFARLA